MTGIGTDNAAFKLARSEPSSGLHSPPVQNIKKLRRHS